MTRLLAFTLAAFVLSACSETQFLMHSAKRLKSADDTGSYKVGEPYQIDGVWYYPSEDWEYDRSGLASWYGPDFHGKKTANGEIYDQWEVSAAHKTLPMPSFVRVTNLENGRELVVRINDRGPYARGRVIDMSRRAAQLLGFEKKGTARVRVQIMASESQALAKDMRSGKKVAADMPPDTQNLTPQVKLVQMPPLITPEGVEVATLAPVVEPAAAPTPPAVETAAAPVVSAVVNGIYIQAGAYSKITNAERVKSRLAKLGSVSISPVTRASGGELYRVRLGPLTDSAAAKLALAEVAQAGFPDAITVVVD